jgi:hypothetical protein
MKNTDSSKFYTAYVVANTDYRVTLQNRAYSFNTAKLGPVATAHIFYDRKKAQSCASNVNASTGWLDLLGTRLTVVPVQLKRRNKR